LFTTYKDTKKFLPSFSAKHHNLWK